jgi:integrase
MLAPSTVANYISGVRAWAIASGFPEPELFTFRVKNALKCLGRIHPPPRQATPVSYDMLEKLLFLLSQTYDDMLIALAFSLLFFGCMRASEVCSDSGGPLLRSHFRFASIPELCLSLEVPVSKTNPHGFVATIGCSAARVCAPCLAYRFFAQYPIHFSQPVFRFSSGKLLSYKILNATLKKLVARLGWDPTKFSTHSFRAGSATAAASAGLAEAEIMKLGRWRSSVYSTYVRPSVLAQASVASILVGPS